MGGFGHGVRLTKMHFLSWQKLGLICRSLHSNSVGKKGKRLPFFTIPRCLFHISQLSSPVPPVPGDLVGDVFVGLFR